MAEITQNNGQVIVDYMARDYDSFLRSMRALIPDKLPEWTEFESEADFGNVMLQLFAHMGDILSYYQDRVATESFLGTAQTRRSIIHHLNLIGYRLATAAPASTALTVSVPEDCNEIIAIKRGDAFATNSTQDNPSVRFEYAGENALEVDCSLLTPVNGRKLIENVPVEEGQLVKDDFLGLSGGTPNQRFPLSNSRLILRALGQGQNVNRDIILTTILGVNRQEWTLQESLAFSREDQTDFVIDIDENDQAVIVFGDSKFGAIPETGSTIQATYRVGGGVLGNVSAESIQTIADAPQLNLLGATVSNNEAATGGSERESIEHAVQHAPSVFRSQKRAVTAADYEALALEFSGVGKVKAEAGNWNAVTLFVAPEGGGQVSDLLEANLLAYFEDLRPVSTRIEIEDVDYLEIFVTAQISVVSYYSQTEVAEKAREAAGNLLASQNVDFGKALHVSKFYEAIETIDGVESVFIPEFRSAEHIIVMTEVNGVLTPDPIQIEENGTITPASSQVPVGAEAYSGLINVTATGGF